VITDWLGSLQGGFSSRFGAIELATRWSRVRFPAAAASTGMGERWPPSGGKPPQYFTEPEPPRPTQPPTLSGTGNECRPKCGRDALRLGTAWGV